MTTTTAAPTGTITPPVAPPKAWFADPGLTAVTPITVTNEGRVFGHVASWSACHTESTALGESCVRAPRSRSAYSGFHLGSLRTAEGDDIAVGHIVAGAPHADPIWGLDSSLVHYSHSGWVGADVRAGEDRFGIWVSGALRPDISPAQLRALKSSPLSGDWRTDPNSHVLEMVAVLAVNAPGFRVPRPQALVASTGAVTSIFGVGSVGRDLVAIRNRAVGLKLEVLGMQVDGFRRGAGLPVPPPRPRPAPRRNIAEVEARAREIHEAALIASMGAPDANTVAWEGILGAEGVPTGDGRLIDAGALEAAPLPLKLRWAKADFGGHEGAIVVGLIQSIKRGPDGLIHGSGVINLGSPEGREVALEIAGGYAGGVSLDLDDSNAISKTAPATDGGVATPLQVVESARIRAATIVAIPAFAEATITLTGPVPDDSGGDGGSFRSDCGCGNPVDIDTTQTHE